MGAGVVDTDGSYAADAVPERSGAGRWRDARRPLASASILATALFAAMAATGVGTGPGPLGDCCGYGAGISRNVGDSFTEGATVLQNKSWFPLVMQDLRPLPAGRGDQGLEVLGVELAELPPPDGSGMIGMDDGDGSRIVPSQRRHAVNGSVLQPEWRVGKDRAVLEVLVRYRIQQEGTWTFRGYEVTYRSGLVRHKAVLDVTLTACAPAAQIPIDDCGPAE